MYYYFSEDIKEDSLLICGDVGGSVRVLKFSPIGRGPFQNRAERPLFILRHIDLVKHPNMLPEMHLLEFRNNHTDWVRQVSFYESLHCVVSCSTCPDSLLMADLTSSKTHNMFRTEKGIQCFAFNEETHVLVTGGPDCIVRVWNAFVIHKPNVVFSGHHAGIISIVLQNGGNTIYSLSRDRVIKVWDVQSQLCVQTYIDVPSQLGERTPISAVYNPTTREYIMASMQIAVLVLDEQLNSMYTDGFTHSRAVSKVLYNPLFKVIITCGMDSIIINWNPLTGKRNVMIANAHTRKQQGELVPVEITAASFDPGYLLLVTGARTGELKVWNFNSGTCLRIMQTDYMQEVTNCFWVEGKILAVGWNRRITEFDETSISTTGKTWELRHTEDVLAAAVRSPLTVATASYNSELVLWKLETGQPYRRFSCTEPMMRIKMTYTKREPKPTPASASATNKSPPRQSISGSRPSGVRTSIRHSMSSRQSTSVTTEDAVAKARARRVSTVTLPLVAQRMRKLAVHACVFLDTRPVLSNVASLFLALENGKIQCWSDHSAGGYQGSFQSVHTAGDYVSALATDVNNEFLFTGSTIGYIKTWLMTNYLTNEHEHINMPKLRLQFPFMWKDRIEGRAKRSMRGQLLPILVNSYRGHLRSIYSIAYIDDRKLLLSGSSDYSVRLWRLSGEYLQTLGSFLPWNINVPRMPPDVKKVASFTTFKVLRSGYVSRYVPGQVEVDLLKDITELELRTKTYGKAPNEPLLGHYFQLPKRPERQDAITLDNSMATIPLYTWLRMASTQPVRRPPTPPLVRATRLKAEAEIMGKARRSVQDSRRSTIRITPPGHDDSDHAPSSRSGM